MYCTHESAHIGLDATYCPDCQQTFNFGSKTYVQILERGSLPEAPEDTKLGVVDDTKSSRGFEVSSASSVPSTHSHQFTPVWQSDCTLISGCNCGEKQECNILELREYQRSCINVRAEYFLTRDKCSSKARHEFTRAIADKDKQIVWLEHQIVELTDETPSELTKESHSFDSSTSTQITPIQIDSELRALIPPLSSEERSQLEVNLVAEGCRDPLVVWKGHHILLDGHNRYEICRTQSIDFNTVEIDLPDRDAAHDWLINNQLGRRNLTPEAVSYLPWEALRPIISDKVRELI